MKQSRDERLIHELRHPRSDYRRAKALAADRMLGIARRFKYWRERDLPAELAANLVGIAVAEKRSGGKPCGEPAVTFCVRRKMAMSRIGRKARLPVRFDGLTCDVVQVGRPRFSSFDPRTAQNPLRPSCQISMQSGNSGTLGGFVQDAAGDTFLVTCAHVVSPAGWDLTSGQDASLLQVLHPNHAKQGTRVIADVAQMSPLASDTIAKVDVAFARLRDQIPFDAELPENLGMISGTRPAEPEEEVYKYGQYSFEGRGYVNSVDVALKILGDDTLNVQFVRLLEIRPSSFSGGGDSGSFIVAKKDNAVVGVLCGVSGSCTYAVPIEEIEKDYQYTWALPQGIAAAR